MPLLGQFSNALRPRQVREFFRLQVTAAILHNSQTIKSQVVVLCSKPEHDSLQLSGGSAPGPCSPVGS